MPTYADLALVTALAYNVQSPQGIPPSVMVIALGLADRYVDSQIAKVFLDWPLLTLTPELVPEQAVIASSLIAAGKVESMLYAVNTAVGKLNQYGMDLEQEGKMMVDDIVNARLLCLGLTRFVPITQDAPVPKIKWVGNLVSQGWLSPQFRESIGVYRPDDTPVNPSPITVPPLSEWYKIFGLELSYSYITTQALWNSYVSTLIADLGRLVFSTVLGPMPTSNTSNLGQLAIQLGGLGIGYIPQASLSTTPQQVLSLVEAGAVVPLVESPSCSVDSLEYQDWVSAMHFAGLNVTSPQFTTSLPVYEPYLEIISNIAYQGSINPESNDSDITFYTGRQFPSKQLSKPLEADINYSDETDIQGAYLIWSILKIITDKTNPIININEHVDENGTFNGLRSFSGSVWTDKQGMTALVNLTTILGQTSGLQQTMRYAVTGPTNVKIVAYSREDGSIVMIISPGLKSTDQAQTLSINFDRMYRINVYLPHESVDSQELVIGTGIGFSVDYHCVALTLVAS